MTIKFIADYPPYKIGNTVTLTSAEETAMVNQKVAVTDLTGGFSYKPNVNKPEGDMALGQVIQKRTGIVKRTNIANGVSYAMSNQGGARENYARKALRIRNFVPAGGLLYIGVETCADYSEGEGDANMRSLNGTKMQIDVEYPPLSGNYMTTYADLQNKVLTKQFGTEKTVFDFVCPVNVDIPEDAICHVTMVCQGRFPMNDGSMIRALAQNAGLTTSTTAGSYVGDLFNSKLTLNGSWGLYTDNGFTAMSKSAREAMTNVSIDGSYTGVGQLWMWTPIHVNFDCDRTCIVSTSDSTDQMGGSSNSRQNDLSGVFGVAGNLFGDEHPVLVLSAFNDSRYEWVNNSSRHAVRSTELKYATHWFDGMGANDVGYFVSPGSESGIVDLYNAFKARSEFDGLIRLGFTIPPFGGVLGSPSYESSGLTDTRISRNLLNDAIRNDKSLYKYYDADFLMTDPVNRNKLKTYKYMRSVTGSVTAGSDILDLTGGSGDFYPYYDPGQRIANADLGGTGVATTRTFIPLNNKQAKLSATVPNAINNGTFYIGACLITASLTDKIHRQDNFYMLLRTHLAEGRQNRSYPHLLAPFGISI